MNIYQKIKNRNVLFKEVYMWYMVNKYEVKNIKGKIGEECVVIPTINIHNNFVR